MISSWVESRVLFSSSEVSTGCCWRSRRCPPPSASSEPAWQQPCTGTLSGEPAGEGKGLRLFVKVRLSPCRRSSGMAQAGRQRKGSQTSGRKATVTLMTSCSFSWHSILHDTEIVSPAFLGCFYVFCPLFILCLSLYFKCFLCRQHTVASCFFIHSVKLCFLTEVRLTKFNTIIVMIEFHPRISLLPFKKNLYWFVVSLPFFLSLSVLIILFRYVFLF